MYVAYTLLYLIGLCAYVPRAVWRIMRSGTYRSGISERFGKRPVQAVVLMSPEQAEEWKTDLNAEREFTGVLTALKPYSRKLYVKRPSSEPAK